MADSVSRQFDSYRFTIESDQSRVKISTSTPKSGFYVEVDGPHTHEGVVLLDMRDTAARKFLRSLISEMDQVLSEAEESASSNQRY